MTAATLAEVGGDPAPYLALALLYRGMLLYMLAAILATSPKRRERLA